MTDRAGPRSVEASAVERLERDLVDAREEIVATNAVLTAMGRSASDLDLVFGAIVDSARNLCRADGVVLLLLDGPHYRLARSSGVSADYVQHMIDHPFGRDPDSLSGRVGLERRAIQIDDVVADPTYLRQDAQRIAGFRTIVGAPMLLDDDVVGVLTVWRTEVDPFDDRAITLLDRVRRRRRRSPCATSTSCAPWRPAPPSSPTRSTSWRRSASSGRR